MRRRILLPAAIGLAFSAAATAQTMTFSGYGTLGAVRSDLETADYTIDAFKPNGPGHTREWSWDVDSRLGLQATAAFTPRLTAVIQVLAQQRYDDSYKPALEWANLKYEAAPDLHVRVGRVVLPMFLLNDSRRIGYANAWVRPPVEVYSLVPVTSSDGADVSYRVRWGEVVNTAQATVGRTDARFPDRLTSGGSGRAVGRRLLTVVDTLEWGPATARLSFGQADLTVDVINNFLDNFRAFGPQGEAIVARYELRGRRVDFLGLGGTYDPGRWFLSGEWARFYTRSLLRSRSAWYVSGGARFDKLTAYATYARAKPHGRDFDPGLDLALLPPQAAPAARVLNAALNEQLGSLAARQETGSVGLRWELLRNAALKIQYDEVRPVAPSLGTFDNPRPDHRPGTRARIFSVALDFVF